jgi:hypothetical protein
MKKLSDKTHKEGAIRNGQAISMAVKPGRD